MNTANNTRGIICPQENHHAPINAQYVIRAHTGGTHRYRCELCRCVFDWYNPGHWSIVTNSAAVALAVATSAAVADAYGEQLSGKPAPYQRGR